MRTTIYAVVYGNGWEDVDYFTSLYHARAKLVIQSLNMNTFHPMLMEYVDGDHGVLQRTKNMMAITDKAALQALDPNDVKANPIIAFNLIKHIF